MPGPQQRDLSGKQGIGKHVCLISELLIDIIINEIASSMKRFFCLVTSVREGL